MLFPFFCGLFLNLLCFICYLVPPLAMGSFRPVPAVGTCTWPKGYRAPLFPDHSALTWPGQGRWVRYSPLHASPQQMGTQRGTGGGLQPPHQFPHHPQNAHKCCQWGVGMTQPSSTWKHPEHTCPNPTLPVSVHRTLLGGEGEAVSDQRGPGVRGMVTWEPILERQGGVGRWGYTWAKAPNPHLMLQWPRGPHLQNTNWKIKLLETSRWWPQNIKPHMLCPVH